MVVFTCKRCGYKTNHKHNFMKHLNRKFKCKPIISDISFVTLITQFNNGSYEIEPKCKHNPEKFTENPEKFTENPYKFTENPEKFTENPEKFTENPENPENPEKFTEKIKKYKCEYCQKNFTRKDNLKTHQKKHCKNKHKKAVGRKTNGQNSLIKYFSNKLDEIEGKQKKEKEKHEKEKEKHEKEKSELRSQIEKLLEKVGNNNNNTTNKIETQIVLNNFGKENIEYINSNYINKLIQQGIYAAIPKIIKFLHFNPEHPENRNVKITNKKEAWAQIWNNDKWELKNKKLVINNIVNKGYNILDDKKKPDELSNKKKSKLCDFQDNYSNDDKDTHKYLNKEVETLILNESKM